MGLFWSTQKSYFFIRKKYYDNLIIDSYFVLKYIYDHQLYGIYKGKTILINIQELNFQWVHKYPTQELNF